MIDKVTRLFELGRIIGRLEGQSLRGTHEYVEALNESADIIVALGDVLSPRIPDPLPDNPDGGITVTPKVTRRGKVKHPTTEEV